MTDYMSKGLAVIDGSNLATEGRSEPNLAQLNEARGDRPKVTVQHLVTASIARTYVEFPMANASVIGNRIERFSHVGVAMPVNLLGHDGVEGHETTMIVVAAFLEAIAVLGMILAFLGGDYRVTIPATAASMIMLILKRPQPGSFFEQVRL